jgi:hypothetical protein
MAKYRFHCTGVITGLTESFGILFLYGGNFVKQLLCAVSEYNGGRYIPSRAAFDVGVFATYPKSSNSLPLQMGASLARV